MFIEAIPLDVTILTKGASDTFIILDIWRPGCKGPIVGWAWNGGICTMGICYPRLVGVHFGCTKLFLMWRSYVIDNGR